MAEIHIERKKGAAWPWVLLGALVVLALLGWLLWPDAADTTPLTATIVDPVPAPATVATIAPLDRMPTASIETPTIATILANPPQWVGREFSGTVTVAEVPTDRGFWVEEGGSRLFAILIDAPAEVPLDINAGQRIRIRGTLRNAAYLPQLPGRPIVAATQELARREPVYLVADEQAITIVDAAAGG
ncbi:MAG TPA: hypothetical protein VEU30_10960 [Thermoanaerobaculia bacterium]|nr:hypothetical protein [Thermoanaerobaculia bacterium]